MKVLMSTHFQKPLGDQKHPMFPSLLSLLSCEDCLLKTLPGAEALQEDVLGTSLGWCEGKSWLIFIRLLVQLFCNQDQERTGRGKQ